jgi:hypothetical protein
MVVDVGLDDLTDGLANAVVVAVKGISDVVTVVDRGPHSSVGGDGEPLSVTYPGFHHV